MVTTSQTISVPTEKGERENDLDIHFNFDDCNRSTRMDVLGLDGVLGN